MKLKRLLKNISDVQVKGYKEIEITGLCANSKCIAPGNLFIAKKGLTWDGAKFIPDAVASGASAIVTDMYDPFFPHIVQVIAKDIAQVEASMAQEFYDYPTRKLYTVGVTGTNGKTTTCYLIKHLFDSLGHLSGLMGTIECIVGQHVFPSSMTTSDVLTNHKLFYEMCASGCRSCVMEVSSHALQQHRVRGIEFDSAVFTNLTQDHLDYHQTMQRYAEAKSTLFSSLQDGEKPFEKTAVINADSPYAQVMMQQCTAAILTYGIQRPCALRATDIHLNPKGMDFTIEFQGRSYPFHSSLIGRFNIYNLLAAIGVGLARSFPLPEILKSLSSFHCVQGRLERVENAKGLHLFVDYAHTDDALVNVLKTLREMKPKRIITVFGCGGNRDQIKRSKMGAAAEEHSDIVILTSDNPRSEDPMEIINHILSGFKQPAFAHIIPDRKEAISAAISLCTPEDILLIAGKGHETHQIFSHTTIPFDDRAVARALCAHSVESLKK